MLNQFRGVNSMRIALDARGANWYKGTGIGTYTENLMKNLITSDDSNKYTFYWSGENYLQYKKSNTSIQMASKRYHRFFEEYYFPNDIKKNNIDIYHIPQNGIGLSEKQNCLKVVTIHDLIPYIMPETVGKGYLLKFLKDMPTIIEMADAIITVSEYSKKDILKFFPIDPDKIFVTPLSANENYKPLNKNMCKQYLYNKYKIDAPFILYIGGFSPRKNVQSLIKAYEMLMKEENIDTKLVICGAKKDELEKIINISNKSKVSSKIIFTDYVPDEDLPIFYNCSEIFVYPSLYEGFGLPPLEAMSCGTPVITSNTSSIPEVTKDSALLLNPYDTELLANSIYKLLTNNELKLNLSQKGFMRSLSFSWEKTAKKTLKVYEKIYENSLNQINIAN